MKIPKRIAQALLNSLKGGVVPRVGLPYIAVGRKEEIDALLHDVDIIAEGGASFRFLVGKYGSGKSFLLQTIRNYVMAKNFVVVDADLSPERRLQGTRGQGLATYKELIRNMSTKTKPEGGALSLILDRWISNVQQEVMASENLSVTSAQLPGLVEKRISAVIYSLNEMVHGFDFARLLTLYYQAYIAGDDETKAKVLKWFRGEYGTKTEARQELGVHMVITDDDWYEYLKLFPNAITRQYNYEKILTMYNDTMQGKAQHLGLILCGTPQCMEDPRRGVYSYEALRSRLAEGHFAGEHKDLLSPVIRLQPLTPEEMLILIEKLADIHAGLYEYAQIVTQQDMGDFIEIEFGRIGADVHITPREVIRDFIEVLDIVYQNPSLQVRTLLNSEQFTYARNAVQEGETDQEFAEFDL